MAGKLISDLNSGTLSLADAMEIDKDVSGTRTSFKTTVKDIVDFANHNVAEEYDSTSTYAIGDYVMYESTLYKCITAVSSAENFDSTKWTAVLVTDEMGSGGGGGTGGHTIIDENGNSMTARAGLQFVGGANVSDDATNNKTIVDLASAGGIDGVFPDFDNVIVAQTNIPSSDIASWSYTATEDCIIFISIQNAAGQSAQICIDGKNITQASGSYAYRATAFTVLKKGQVVTVTGNVNTSVNTQYAVYGIQTGTTHSKFHPVIYSLEEREIGVWTDGKPLYEKTIIDTLPSSTTSKDIALNISNIDKIVSLKGIAIRSDGATTQIEHARTDDTIWSMINGAKTVLSINIKDSSYINQPVHFTVQYTKTTDTAGSGTWTPQGVPTHHYSTEEQIIGTWIDGKTLYEKTILVNNGGNLNTGDNVITHNISNFGKLIDAKGNAIRNTGSSGGRDMVIPYASGDTNSTWDIGIYEFDSTKGYIKVGNAYTGDYILHDCYVTLQYTKSS